MTTPPPRDENSALSAWHARSRQRRRALWLLAAVAGLIFATIFGVIVYSDAPEPDLSDLAFEPIAVPDEENLYLILVKRGTKLSAAPIMRFDQPPPPGLVLPQGDQWREQLRRGEAWNDEAVTRYGAAWDAFATEISDAHERYPLMQGSTPTALQETVPVLHIHEVALNLNLAARARHHAGHTQDAINTALDGYELGLRLSDARGPLIDYLVGSEIQQSFCRFLLQLASLPEASAAELAQIADGLRAQRRENDAIAHSLRNDARLVGSYLLELDAEEVNARGTNYYYHDIKPLRWIAQTRVLFPLVYKPNLTLGLYADALRTQIAELDLPHNLRSRPKRDFVSSVEIADLRHPYNLLGRIIAESASTRVGSTRDGNRTRIRLLECHVALRRFHQANGELPAALSDLVPVYLDKVPLDLADGAPLRYSREFRAIWSGLDGFIMRTANEPIRERDIVLRLEFAAPLTPPPAAPPAADGSPPRAASANP